MLEDVIWFLFDAYGKLWEERDELNKKLFRFRENFIKNRKVPEHLVHIARVSQEGNALWAKIKAKELLVKHGIKVS